MSTNAHKDGAKMARKSRKAEARRKAYTKPDGTMMSHYTRRMLQRGKEAERYFATYDGKAGRWSTENPPPSNRPSTRALYSDVMQRNPVVMDTLQTAETAEKAPELRHSVSEELTRRTKAPPVVDPLRSERAKRAAATRKLNKARAIAAVYTDG